MQSEPPRLHLPSHLEILIEPGPPQLPYHGQATLRANHWISVPLSQLSLKILPSSGDVHFDPKAGTYRIEIELAALVQKPKAPPPDPPLIILP